jgi:hypothetical protein
MSKKQKSTTTSQPWQPAQGNILGAINTVQDTVNGNQGNLNSIAGGITSQLPGLAQKAFGDSPLLNAGNSYATDVLGGKYLTGNPYMDQMIGQTDQSVRDQVNSMFGKSGMSMGSPYAAEMTKELANSENNLRYGDYSQERTNQQQVAQMIPSLFAGQFSGVSPYLQAAQTGGTLPYAGLGALSPIIGLAGGSGTGTQTQPSNLLNSILGAAASLGSAALMA